ncbi:MAG: nitrilase-related carbon-nitrogen hydrolase [Actinomycetes bacterium]
MDRTVRVVAAQFSIGTSLDDNLTEVLDAIGRALEHDPDLVVLPEFCNHLSIYDDGQHAWDVAVDLDGPFVTAVRERVAGSGAWVQLNCTVRRQGPSTSREPAPGRITNTNLLIGPDGQIAGESDKTVLMGAEGDFLSAAAEPSALVETPFGTVGSYACMDGVVPEVPRAVAVRGAEVMCNSLNSFALDEASLHVPVRAAENRTWVVACCKVGPLLPADKIELFSTAMQVPGEFLRGAGESQIVAPDGEVVAIGPRDGRAEVVADIDLARSGQLRPDGTDLRAARRPELYGALAAPTPAVGDHPRASSVRAAAVVNLAQAAGALADGATLVVLPELVGTVEDLQRLAASAPGSVLVGSVVDDGAHRGVVVDATGVLASQDQLHAVARHAGFQTRLGDGVEVLDLPWGRLAVMVGEDALYPEVARLAALASCDVLAVPTATLEAWECATGLVERAAENRVNLVAATAGPVGSGLVVSLPPDFTLWAPSRERTFDGTINLPDVHRAADGAAVVADVHPARSVNRQISKGTNLVDGRPWRLFEPLV